MVHPRSSGAGGCLSGIHLGQSNEEGDPVGSHPGRSTARVGGSKGEKKGDREERGKEGDEGSWFIHIQGTV